MDTLNQQKILVGSDTIEVARENFPYIPGTRVNYSSTPDDVVARVREGDISVLVTALDYSPGGKEGFRILENLVDVPVRKVLWVLEDSPEIRARAAELGAEVLGRNQLASLVGQVISNAPLKEGGKILLYATEVPLAGAFAAVMEVFGFKDEVLVSTELNEALKSGEFGLVIDTSPTCVRDKKAQSKVAESMKYLELPEVPRVEVLRDLMSCVAEIAQIAHRHIEGKKPVTGIDQQGV